LKKLFKWLGLGVVALMGVVVVIWVFPGLVLNSTTLEFARSFVGKRGIQITWEKGELHAKSVSFFKKEVSLNVSRGCVDISAQNLHACFDVLDAQTVAGLQKFEFKFFKLGPVKLAGAKVRYVVPESKEAPEEKKEKSAPASLPSWLTLPELAGVDIRVDRAEIVTSDREIVGSLTLTENTEAQRHRYDLTAEASVPQGKSTLKAGLKAEISIAGEKLTVVGNGSYREGKRSVTASFSGDTTLVDHHLSWSAEANGLAPQLSRIVCTDCSASLEKEENEQQNLKLDCPVRLALRLPSAVDLPFRKLVQTLGVRLGVELQRKDGDPKSPITGKVTLDAEPLFETLKEGKGSIAMDVEGKVDDSLGDWAYALDSNLSIEHFEKIVTFLKETEWAVPAPLNNLRGPITINVKGEGALDKLSGTFPVTVKTQLESESQKLFLTAENTLTLSPQSDALDVNVMFEEVRLILPRLDLKKPPRFVPDSRIHRYSGRPARPEPKKASAKPFKLSLKIGSRSEDAIRLSSNFAKQDVPLQLDINMPKADQLSGSIRTREFKLDLFRRDAQVDSLQIKLHPDSTRNEIFGKVRVFYVDYTITIRIMGLLSRPEVHVESDPPLPEKQALAVLLFGRSLNELDSDSADSVGNTNAALADGAIGLASLYALASTPIESVGYDTRTQTFTAKVKLADGTSLTIGSDLSEVNQLGIRRRLTSQWSLNTYLENPFLSAERTLTSALEWSLRY